jgi:hypothetical protein
VAFGCHEGFLRFNKQAYPTLQIAHVRWYDSDAVLYRAIDRGTCFHFEGHDSPCGVSVNKMIVLFGILQVRP